MSYFVWRLQKGMDRRFRLGHPWVFSNELAAGIKALEPGFPVELHDPQGRFLAYGYGNPNSLITFRALGRDEEEQDSASPEGVIRRLISALRLRVAAGLGNVSHRLSYGEADRLPGLVIDSYKVDGGRVLAVQILSAGMAHMLRETAGVFEKFVKQARDENLFDTDWKNVSIVLRNDVKVRKLEGLAVEEPSLLREGAKTDLKTSVIDVAAGDGNKNPVAMSCDLIGGQKTGFFLDQAGNISLLASTLHRMTAADSLRKEIRVLDLCCYVGQWGTQIAAQLTRSNRQVHVTGVDGSQAALDFARQNVERAGGTFESVKGDVLTDLPRMPSESFDIVICDPPAFIKTRKDADAGKHAYMKLNSEALRLSAPGALIVSCSCSQRLSEEDLIEVLNKAQVRTQRNVQWIAKGTQSPDHPQLTEFPEGRYLKSWIGRVSDSLGRNKNA